MTIEMLTVFTLVVVTVVLFATEKLTVDLVALLIMAALLGSRIVTPEEGIAGFSNTATVTIGAMFVLSAGLFKSGAVNFIGRALERLGKRSFWAALLVMMPLVALLSAFMNNTAVVAILLPPVLGASRAAKVSPSKLLMPLSFASIFGGTCTLIGTSTNILISSIVERHSLPPFTMFDFSSLGLVFFGAGFLYMVLIGIRLIPDRRTDMELTETFGMGDYLTTVVLLPEAKSVGMPVEESPLVRDLGIDILEINRDESILTPPLTGIILRAGDLLQIRCNLEKIRELQEGAGIRIKPSVRWQGGAPQSRQTVLVEAVIAPNSELDGRSLRQISFHTLFGASGLAIRHRGQLLRETVGSTILRGGDALLIQIRRDRLDQLRNHDAFVLISEVELPRIHKEKSLLAATIVAGVVLGATFNLAPIVVAAILGCVLMVMTRVITMEEAYAAIRWRIVFLLAGVLTLGTALEKTGAARLLSDLLIASVGMWGPAALVAAFYLLTSLLTEAMSNNATAALLAPVAITAASSLGVDSKPLLMAVTFAASSSFMTPVGYQTNTLIYEPGQYKFFDFVRVGGPLNLLFWVLATVLIPVFWHF